MNPVQEKAFAASVWPITSVTGNSLDVVFRTIRSGHGTGPLNTSQTWFPGDGFDTWLIYVERVGPEKVDPRALFMKVEGLPLLSVQ